MFCNKVILLLFLYLINLNEAHSQINTIFFPKISEDIMFTPSEKSPNVKFESVLKCVMSSDNFSNALSFHEDVCNFGSINEGGTILATHIDNQVIGKSVYFNLTYSSFSSRIQQ